MSKATYEYRDEPHFADVQRLAAEGWRLHTAAFLDAGMPGTVRGWTYILERQRVEKSPAEAQRIAEIIADAELGPDNDKIAGRHLDAARALVAEGYRQDPS